LVTRAQAKASGREPSPAASVTDTPHRADPRPIHEALKISSGFVEKMLMSKLNERASYRAIPTTKEKGLAFCRAVKVNVVMLCCCYLPGITT
jgi:hypothetical protein